ncbi:hypothetical protein LTS18_006059, partial [Coniosporium uncinatum]
IFSTLFPGQSETKNIIDSTDTSNLQDEYKIVFLGGGAGAEAMALAFLRFFYDKGYRELWTTERRGASQPHLAFAPPGKCTIETLDIADWEQVLIKLYHASSRIWSNSSVPETDGAPTVEHLDNTHFTSFKQCDILDLDPDTMRISIVEKRLITLMFTLNELYTTSHAKTTTFLLNLTSCTQPGTVLLVVDSPGSYSSMSVNGSEKKYPMHFMLDHTLLTLANRTSKRSGAGQEEIEEPCWEKLRTEESTWFRLPKELRYPIPLEDMRYQLHLYRRLPKSTT